MRCYEAPVTLRAEVERQRSAGPSLMEADRWVRIRCDFAVGSVWSRDGTPGRLPISFDLMARLHRWQDLSKECDD